MGSYGERFFFNIYAYIPFIHKHTDLIIKCLQHFILPAAIQTRNTTNKYEILHYLLLYNMHICISFWTANIESVINLVNFILQKRCFEGNQCNNN